MKTASLIGLALGLALTGTAANAQQAPQPSGPAPRACPDAVVARTATIAPDSARAAALSGVPGGSIASTAWGSKGATPYLSYEVIKPPADTTEVQVDATTGKVLKQGKRNWTTAQRVARQQCQVGMTAPTQPSPKERGSQ